MRGELISGENRTARIVSAAVDRGGEHMPIDLLSCRKNPNWRETVRQKEEEHRKMGAIGSHSLPVRPCQGSGPGSRPPATSASRLR